MNTTTNHNEIEIRLRDLLTNTDNIEVAANISELLRLRNEWVTYFSVHLRDEWFIIHIGHKLRLLIMIADNKRLAYDSYMLNDSQFENITYMNYSGSYFFNYIDKKHRITEVLDIMYKECKGG